MFRFRANFKHFLHPQYGNCYPFISDVDITRPGTQQQFRMLFTVNARFYTFMLDSTMGGGGLR